MSSVARTLANLAPPPLLPTEDKVPCRCPGSCARPRRRVLGYRSDLDRLQGADRLVDPECGRSRNPRHHRLPREVLQSAAAALRPADALTAGLRSRPPGCDRRRPRRSGMSRLSSRDDSVTTQLFCASCHSPLTRVRGRQRYCNPACRHGPTAIVTAILTTSSSSPPEGAGAAASTTVARTPLVVLRL